MPEFDVVTSPLRAGGSDAVPRPLVVEAGAGTGKTWTLAHLATRFMIEDGVEPDQVLMVTFTRDAARELRGRVRARLAEVRDFLVADRPAAGAVEAHLASRWVEGSGRADDARRARHCLAGLDGLHARTIHSFAAVSVPGAAGRAGEDARLWRHASRLVTSRWALEEPARFRAWRDAGGEGVLDAVVHALYDAGVRPGGRRRRCASCPRPTAPAPTTRWPRPSATWPSRSSTRYVDLARRAGRTSFADLLVALAGRIGRRDARAVPRRAARELPRRDDRRVPGHRPAAVARVPLSSSPTRPTRAWSSWATPSRRSTASARGRSRRSSTVAAAARDGAARPRRRCATTTGRRPGLVDALNASSPGTDFHYSPDGAEAGEPGIAFSRRSRRATTRASPLAARRPDASLHLRVALHGRPRATRSSTGVAGYVSCARQCRRTRTASRGAVSDLNTDCDKVHRYLVAPAARQRHGERDSIFDVRRGGAAAHCCSSRSSRPRTSG